MFHPTQRNWALAASWTNCAEFVDEPCKIYKELYITKDLGEEWNFVNNYVFDFEWGQSTYARDNGVKIPDERIFATRDPNSSGHQATSKIGIWSPNIDCYMSDDLFATQQMVVESGNTLVKTPQYMFVAVSHTDEQRITIYSSNYKSGFAKIKKVRLPVDAVLSRTFTLMDTSEQQVFLFIENHGLESPFGNLYISGEGGHSFSLSMENVIKGSAVDFEKVASLDGTFIVNKYISEHDHKRNNKGVSVFAPEFDEADIVAEENKKSRLSRGGSSVTSSKQAATLLDVYKIEDSIAAT